MTSVPSLGLLRPFSILAVDKRHASEACYLAQTREALLRRIDRDFADLSRLDRKLERHVYALSVGSNPMTDVMERETRLNSPGRFYVELSAALRANDDKAVSAILRQCTQTRGHRGEANQRHAALAFAAQLANLAVQSRLTILWNGADPAAQRIAFDAVTSGAGNLGGMLQQALSSNDALLRARAYRVLGETGNRQELPVLRAALVRETGSCRFQAAWSCAVLGDTSDLSDLAIAELAAHLSLADPDGWEALCALMIGIPAARSTALVQDLLQDQSRWAIAAMAMGLFGDARFVPWLVDKLEQPALARACFASLTMILGISPASYSNRVRKREPSSCPWLDERLENWPMPDVLGIRQYWQEHAANFLPGQRYWLGTEAEPARVAGMLFAGPLFLRPIAALIGACLTRPNRVFPTAAAAAAQSRLLCFDPAT